MTTYGTSCLTGVSPYALYGTLNVTSTGERHKPVTDGVHLCPVESGRVAGVVLVESGDKEVVEVPSDGRSKSRETRNTFMSEGPGTDCDKPPVLTDKTVDDVSVLGLLVNITKFALKKDTS